METANKDISIKSTAPGHSSENVVSIPGASSFKPKKKTHFWIPYEFICDLKSVEDKRAFAVWLKLKSVFNDTKFMNYSVSSCSQVTGISPYLLRKYIPIIIANEWGRMVNKDLVLLSFKKIFDRSRNNVTIDITGSVSNIENELVFSHVAKDYSQQKFMSDVGLGRLKASQRSQKKTYKEYYHKSMCQYRTYTSYRRIANKCNVSLSRAYELCKGWVEDGKMSIKTEFETIAYGVRGKYTPHMTEFGLVKRGSHGRLILVTGSSFKVYEQFL